MYTFLIKLTYIIILIIKIIKYILLKLHLVININKMSTAFKRAQKIKQTAETSLFDEDKQVADDQSSSSSSEDHFSSDSDHQIDTKEELTKKVKKSLVEQDAEEKTQGKKVEDDHELSAFKDQDAESKEWKNRQRTLVLCARGVKSKFRLLMDDIIDMLPHSKKENKIERKVAKDYINDLCFQRSCNNCIFLESRKRTDYFLWLMKSPEGPSIKFSVQNIHTADELKMTGNCLKYSRPLLSFDGAFNSAPHL